MERPLSNPRSLLDRPTLVLNRSWLPIHVTPARRAITLVYRGVASVVQTDTYETFDFLAWARQPVAPGKCVRTVRLRIPLPEVIVLRSFDRVTRRHIPFTRRNLFRRDRLRCQYCGCRPGTKNLTIDHVQPRRLGGVTSWTNCVLACAKCNGRKGGRRPEEVGMRLLQRPVQPQWSAALGKGVPWLDRFLSGETRTETSTDRQY